MIFLLHLAPLNEDKNMKRMWKIFYNFFDSFDLEWSEMARKKTQIALLVLIMSENHEQDHENKI